MAARTPITPIKLAPSDTGADAAEALTAIDQPNGMQVLTSSVVRHVLLRVTNSAGAPHSMTIISAQQKGNPRATYGAAGPSGSAPSEPDITLTAVPAGGTRYVAVGARSFQTDNSLLLSFDAGMTGTICAIEVT